MSYDEAVKLNTAPLRGGAAYNYVLHQKTLHDVATALFYWECDGDIPFKDLLRIEEYLFRGQPFGIFRVRVKVGDTVIRSKFRVLPSIKTRATHIKIAKGKLGAAPIDWDYAPYRRDLECVMFDSYTQTVPFEIACKYAEVLTQLDAMYAQNIEKISLPVVFRTEKSQKNDLIKIMKEGAVNKAFSVVEGANVDTDSIFQPNIPFILDRIRTETEELMNQYISTLGISPNIRESSQYVNKLEIGKSSIANKALGAGLYRARVAFCRNVNTVFPSIGLRFRSNVNYDMGGESSGLGSGEGNSEEISNN